MFKKGVVFFVAAFAISFSVIGSEKKLNLNEHIAYNEKLNMQDGLKQVMVLSAPIICGGASLILSTKEPSYLSCSGTIITYISWLLSSAWAGHQFAELEIAKERRIAENRRLNGQSS